MKPYFLKFKKENALAFLWVTLWSLLFVGASVILTPLMNSAIEKDLKKVLPWFTLFCLVWALITITGYLAEVAKEKAIQKMSTQLREDIMKNLTTYSYEEFTKEKEGKFTSWFNNDLKLIQENGFKSVYTLYKSVLQVIGACGVLLFFHYSLLILSLLLAGLLIFVPRLFSKRIAVLTENIKGANENFLVETQDILGSFTTFQTHNLQNTLINNIKKSSYKLAQENIAFTKGEGKGEMVIDATNIVAQFGTILWTIFLVLKDKVTAGTMFSVGNISSILFNNLATVFSQILVIQTIPSILNKNFKPGSYEKNTSSALAEFKNEIVLQDVSYAYENKKVLEDISYTFKKNGKYAITGKSGSGKSTLLNLLGKRLENYQGSIMIDGKELRSLSNESLQNLIEFVEQKPYFFNDTVGNNISLQLPYEKEKMADILHHLNISDFATDTDLVRERGKNFSGGQGQRLAIGRGLLFKKELLFLDEITAGLDQASSREIEDLILNDPNLTVIMITHHLSPATKEKLDGILEI